MFDYLECTECGTIQVIEIPDLAAYYPEEYYSFNSVDNEFSDKWSTKLLARSVVRYFLGQYSLFGNALSRIKSWPRELFPDSLRERGLQLRLDSSILDVGCGGGNLLEILNFFGFTDLTGADLFIKNDIKKPSGVTIYKKSLEDLQRKFDLVMFNHSFEHLVDPVQTLKAAVTRLAPGGTCLIRMPVVAEAWNIYGPDWVQLDPPRHTFIFSPKGFAQLATSLGFTLYNVTYDSTAFQFWGSELYRQDEPLQSVLSGEVSQFFESAELERWKDRAIDLNRSGKGDQACFYLRHSGSEP